MIDRAIKHLKKYPFLYNTAKRIAPMVACASRYCVAMQAPGASTSKKINFVKAEFSARHALARSMGKPILVTIEPSNICDQRCPICETGAGVLRRKKSLMTFEEFTSIVDQFDSNLDQMFFYGMGEPFLNKDAYAMIRYAADKGIWVSSCTNGNSVDPEKLVASGIGEINFQIAGMTQESHSRYRVGGNLKKALDTLVEAIRVRNRSAPATRDRMKILAGFILMKHNEHEVDEFIEFCNANGVDQYNIIGTCLRTVDQWETYMPTDRNYWIYSEDEYRQGRLVPSKRPDNYCGWIYSSVTIHVNGDVVPCCRDVQGDYCLGNVLKENLYDIWSNKKSCAIRKSVSTRSNSFPLCLLCPGEGMTPLSR
jgi:radical SAM protein with 4Fe4S-binding SPASM domain